MAFRILCPNLATKAGLSQHRNETVLPGRPERTEKASPRPGEVKRRQFPKKSLGAAVRRSQSAVGKGRDRTTRELWLRNSRRVTRSFDVLGKEEAKVGRTFVKSLKLTSF